MSGKPAKLSPAASAEASKSLGVARMVANMYDLRPIEWIRTGIPALDLVIGAGIPRGRLIEIIGEYSTAKSALVYVMIGAFQRAGGQCILIDSEQKTDKVFAEKMGADMSPGKIGYDRGESLKEAVQLIGRVAQQADPSIPTLVAWDSIAATPGADELEDIVSDREFKGEMGARARELSFSLRGFMNNLAKKNVTFVAVNQLRTRFNFMGMASQESSGGKAPKYHSGVRLMMRQKGRIRHKERDVIVGVAIEIETIKNSCAPPFRKAVLKFRFDSGFDRYSGLDELLLRHGRIEQKGGWLTYKDKSFHASDMERIVGELPELILPIQGVLDQPSNGQDAQASPVEANAEEHA